MSSHPTRTEIRKVLAEHGKLSVDIDTIADDADLFAVGMTSFASVNVMLALEEAFDVEFPDSMLNRSAFESVDAMSHALETIAAPA